MDPIEGSQDFGERMAQACSYQAHITQDFFFLARKGARMSIITVGFIPALFCAGIAPGPCTSQGLRPAQLAASQGHKQAEEQRHPQGGKWTVLQNAFFCPKTKCDAASRTNNCAGQRPAGAWESLIGGWMAFEAILWLLLKTITKNRWLD